MLLHNTHTTTELNKSCFPIQNLIRKGRYTFQDAKHQAPIIVSPWYCFTKCLFLHVSPFLAITHDTIFCWKCVIYCAQQHRAPEINNNLHLDSMMASRYRHRSTHIIYVGYIRYTLYSGISCSLELGSWIPSCIS